MADPKDLENKPTEPPVDSGATDGDKTQKSDSTDWKTSYQGLQRVVAQRDQTILKLTQEKQNAINELEELKQTSGHTELVKADLEKSKGTLEAQVITLTAENTGLKTQNAQLKIIMQEFPQLSGLIKYIPPATDDEGFRQNAKAFADELAGQVKLGLKEVLTGATPPQPENGKMTTEAEEDALYTQVVALAGIPGKEAEYEKLRQKWVKLKLAQK
jgi:hypothetical protein